MSRTSVLCRFVAVTAAGVAVVAGVLPGPTVASAATATPRVPAGLPAAVEPLATYVEQTACDPVPRAGTVALARLLAATYRSYGGATWMSTYACGTDGTRSEHYDGRAIDWMVGVRNAHQRAAATAAITWLLATDSRGNRFAMARRLGVMYLIFDNRIWGAWDGRWSDYNGCSHRPAAADDNACHRTHVHISLSWNGALGHTTFWQRRVSPTDFGPCRPRDLNWAFRYAAANRAGCPGVAAVRAASGSSATKKGLVTWSGAWVHGGSRGPAVSAVQRAFRIAPTGAYGSTLTSLVRSFQARHHVPVTGSVTPATWRMLLAVVR